MNAILEKLGSVLAVVQSPARYMGGEANSVRRDLRAVRGSMALVFPDVYEIGMSHNGTRVLYHCINRQADLLCEVAFAPWEDMAEQMRQRDIVLYTHASWTPVREFDLIGISLQTELNFTNVPYVLELAGVPAWARYRGERDPLVVGGGPSVANPEPVADFFDFFVIGDGEELAPQVVRYVGEARRSGVARRKILEDLAEWDGIYVPSLEPVRAKRAEEGLAGELIPLRVAKGSYRATEGVRRVWIERLKPEYYPVNNLIANMPLVHDRYAIEISRGCTQGCRFCQAGIWYRPSRELSPDDVIRLAKQGLRATGERQLGLLSLSSADYSQIEPLTDAIIDQPVFDAVDVSLPSLRANSFGQSLARKVAALKGGRSATFAPETGSERLRRLINKTLTDQDMIEAAQSVFANGFTKIKLYTMIGLPTENLDDMEAFCSLIEKLVAAGRPYNSKIQIHASIGVLVPKAFTPFQWAPFMERERVYTHLRYVRDRFRWHKQVKITYSDWETAHLEAVYSRGDRRLAPLIYEAYRRGQIFESHGEKISYAGWLRLWQEFGYDPSWVFGERDENEVFPWDFLHAGVTKAYLLNEWRKALNPQSNPVPDCKWGACQHCGIPGNGADTQLAGSPLEYRAPSRSEKEIADLVAARRPRYDQVYHYEFEFKKTGISRFLPHQNTLSFFERSLARLDIPIKFSEGFSPKPRIHNTGALPLGLESLCEVISIELLKPLPLQGEDYQQLLRDISATFPAGMEVLAVRPLREKLSRRVPASVLYTHDAVELPGDLLLWFREKRLPVAVNHRGQRLDLNEHVLDLQIQETDGLKRLSMRVKTNDQGNTASPFSILAGLLGLSDEQARALNLVKRAVFFD